MKSIEANTMVLLRTRKALRGSLPLRKNRVKSVQATDISHDSLRRYRNIGRLRKLGGGVWSLSMRRLHTPLPGLLRNDGQLLYNRL